MGQVFDKLTNPAVVSPNGQMQFYSGAPQAGMALARQAAQTAQPSTADVGENGPTFNNPQPQQPKMVKPSFMQAQGSSGMPNAASPGLSKAGKLVTLLSSGIQGALAGRAAQERTIAESGGHRSGGVGTGFQAGIQAPFQRAAMGQNLQQQQAQTELTKQQATMVQTPYGMLPAALAKVLLPAQIGAQGKVEAAKIGAGAKEAVADTAAQTQEKVKRFIPVPGVGLFDSQTRQVVPDTGQGIEITPEIAADHSLPEAFVGKRMSLQQLAAVQRSDVFQNSPMMTAQGPVVINRKTSTARPVTGPGGQTFSPPALASPREVGDPDNPGQTKIVSGGSAIAQGAAGPASASVQVPRKAALAEVPSKIGDQKVGFNTAIQHADLLRQAAKALNNGDVRMLNNLSNRAATEFGDPALTDFNAIANAYNHEVTNVLAKGHITDAEVAKGGGTMPSGANYATIDKVLNSYQALMKSKMNMLNQQKQSAVSQSQPKGTKSNDAPIRTIVF